MGRIRENKVCMQRLDAYEMMEQGCSYSECRHCGFNKNVHRYRKEMIAKYGLTKGKDGLWRFIIKRWRDCDGSARA